MKEEQITKHDLLEHWDQTASGIATAHKIVMEKLKESNDAIGNKLDKVSFELEKITAAQEGTNGHLRELNGSVGKHEQRLNEQNVMNAQTTITQQQIIKDLSKMMDNDTGVNNYMQQTKGAINTFKWLVGFIGIGTLATLIKVFTQ